MSLNGPKSPYAKGEEKRKRIAEAVIDTIAKSGIHHTTFEEIGKRAKLKRSHIVYYYKNHDELILAAVKEVATTAQQMTAQKVLQAKTPRTKVFAILEGAFEHIRQYPKHGSVFLLFYHLCTHNQNYKLLHTQVRKTGEERLKGILELLFQDKMDKELHLLAKSIQTLITGFLLEWLSSDCFESLESCKTLTKKSLNTLLGSQ